METVLLHQVYFLFIYRFPSGGSGSQTGPGQTGSTPGADSSHYDDGDDDLYS